MITKKNVTIQPPKLTKKGVINIGFFKKVWVY